MQDYQPMKEGHRIYFDVITARAYAAIDDILSSTFHLQNEATSILVMQGKLDEHFISEQHKLVESLSLDVYGLEAERHLLEIKKV